MSAEKRAHEIGARVMRACLVLRFRCEARCVGDSSGDELDSSVIRKDETELASLQPFRKYSLYGGRNRLQVAV